MLSYSKSNKAVHLKVEDLFFILSELVPQNSFQYDLYLYHLRQLAIILDRVECGEDLTSTLRLLTKIGAELPLS